MWRFLRCSLVTLLAYAQTVAANILIDFGAHGQEPACEHLGQLQGHAATDETFSGRFLQTQSCDDLLSADEISSIQSTIQTNAVAIFAVPNTRCLEAAQNTLETREACYDLTEMSGSSATWSYFQCLYPDEKVGSTPMHSYVFIGGEFVGNGFKLLLDQSDYRCTDQGGMPCLDATQLDTKLSAASVATTCARDCSGFVSDQQASNIQHLIDSAPLVLLGWNGCPCTNIARDRFQSKGACFVENVWSESNSAVMEYLQCRFGREHHSFVWFGGEFQGNGFDLQESAMPDNIFQARLDAAGTSYMCQHEGDANLHGGSLQSCTQSNDGSTTGWTRSGSCVWDPSDAGYHQVCVTMSQTFLESSARYDNNDLSSVVQEGGHWCICAWAWASAVSRDPTTYEGIELDCSRTNGRLRNVFESHIQMDTQLRSPSGAHYRAQEALQAVNSICGTREESQNSAGDALPSGTGILPTSQSAKLQACAAFVVTAISAMVW